MFTLSHRKITRQIAAVLAFLALISLSFLSLPTHAQVESNQLVVEGEGSIVRFLNPDCFITQLDCVYVIQGSFEGIPENGTFVGGYRIDPGSATPQETGGFCYEFEGIIGANYDQPRFSFSLIQLNGTACEVLEEGQIVSQNVEGTFSVFFGTKKYRKFLDTGSLNGSFLPTGEISFSLI